MQIDGVFFLCAGSGSRMGDVGKVIPKPLLKFFESTLLEAHFRISHELSKNFYINTHHLSNSFSFLNDKYKNINILNEIDLLDVGGAIHNLKRNFPLLKKVLIINSDQFYFFSKKEMEKAFSFLEDSPVVLFGTRTKKESRHNQIIIKDHSLIDIIKNEYVKEINYLTYSGNCLIDLSKIDFIEGPSSFFESVAMYKQKDIKVYIPENYEYYDLGTSQRYIDSIFKIIKYSYDESSLFCEKLKEYEIIDYKKILKYSYNIDSKYVANFTSNKITDLNARNIVVLERSRKYRQSGIYLGDIVSNYI